MLLEPTTPRLGEALLTVKEAAAKFGWSYDTTLRHFRHVNGILRRPSVNRYSKRRTRIYIPESVLLREWEKLVNAVPAREIHERKNRSVLKQAKLSADQWIAIERQMDGGEPISKVANAFGITRQAIYKHLKRTRVGTRGASNPSRGAYHV